MQYSQPAGPWQSNSERLVSEALAVGDVPGAVLATIRPPLPQINPFPPRFGYGDAVQRTPGIDMVLSAYRYYPDAHASNSGGPGGWQGSARNVGAGTW